MGHTRLVETHPYRTTPLSRTKFPTLDLIDYSLHAQGCHFLSDLPQLFATLSSAPCGPNVISIGNCMVVLVQFSPRLLEVSRFVSLCFVVCWPATDYSTWNSSPPKGTLILSYLTEVLCQENKWSPLLCRCALSTCLLPLQEICITHCVDYWDCTVLHNHVNLTKCICWSGMNQIT